MLSILAQRAVPRLPALPGMLLLRPRAAPMVLKPVVTRTFGSSPLLAFPAAAAKKTTKATKTTKTTKATATKKAAAKEPAAKTRKLAAKKPVKKAVKKKPVKKVVKPKKKVVKKVESTCFHFAVSYRLFADVTSRDPPSPGTQTAKGPTLGICPVLRQVFQREPPPEGPSGCRRNN